MRISFATGQVTQKGALLMHPCLQRHLGCTGCSNSQLMGRIPIIVAALWHCGCLCCRCCSCCYCCCQLLHCHCCGCCNCGSPFPLVVLLSIKRAAVSSWLCLHCASHAQKATSDPASPSKRPREKLWLLRGQSIVRILKFSDLTVASLCGCSSGSL